MFLFFSYNFHICSYISRTISNLNNQFVCVISECRNSASKPSILSQIRSACETSETFPFEPILYRCVILSLSAASLWAPNTVNSAQLLFVRFNISQSWEILGYLENLENASQSWCAPTRGSVNPRFVCIQMIHLPPPDDSSSSTRWFIFQPEDLWVLDISREGLS